MGSTLSRDAQVQNSVLTTLRTLEPWVIGSLNCVYPLAQYLDYSGTSDNRHSEKRTISIGRTNQNVLIHFPVLLTSEGMDASLLQTMDRAACPKQL